MILPLEALSLELFVVRFFVALQIHGNRQATLQAIGRLALFRHFRIMFIKRTGEAAAATMISAKCRKQFSLGFVIRLRQMEEPPPLEDMSEFVHRLKKMEDNKCKQEPLIRQDNASLMDDSFQSSQDKFMLVQNKSKQEAADEAAAPLKKGFLNAPTPRKAKAPSKHIPFVTARKQDIPDFMRVSSPMDQYRQELHSLLKPTQELVSDVLNNQGIKGGLDDPEIMAAVQDIASNPDAIHKYRNNAKVTRFYSQLGNLMGEKIEKQAKRS